ncbi:MAG TPA: hypothetical protein VKA18_02770 [Alphaproteobacteria bacterium]|nr:hypothetical protein [Alphaproteobacteria bacterium]
MPVTLPEWVGPFFLMLLFQALILAGLRLVGMWLNRTTRTHFFKADRAVVRQSGARWIALYFLCVFAIGLVFDGLIGHRLGLFAYPPAADPASAIGADWLFFVLNSALSYLLFSLTILQFQELRGPRIAGERLLFAGLYLLVAFGALSAISRLPDIATVFAAGAVVVLSSEILAVSFGTLGLLGWALARPRQAAGFWFGTVCLASLYEAVNAAVGLWDWQLFPSGLAFLELPAVILLGYPVLAAPYFVLNNVFFGCLPREDPAA